jgi:hypothetical protein
MRHYYFVFLGAVGFFTGFLAVLAGLLLTGVLVCGFFGAGFFDTEATGATGLATTVWVNTGAGGIGFATVCSTFALTSFGVFLLLQII